MTRSERFFLWLGRFNALAIFLFVLFAAGMIATEYLRDYNSRQGIERAKFGNEVADSGPYSGESINVAGGQIAAYYQKGDDSFDRREGSDITLVDPRSGRTRRVAGDDDDAWVLRWDLIFRQGKEGGTAIGYVAHITTETQYNAGKFDLVVGNLPALEQKVIARNVMGVDLPTIDGEAGAALIMWNELDKAAFVAIDLRDLSITAQRDIPLPIVRTGELTQGPGRQTPLRHGEFAPAEFVE